MTRTEALALITEKLASLDDEHLLTVADIVAAMGDTRRLSERERELVERSKADFASGRTLSHEEAVGLLDARLAALGVPKSAA